MLSTKSVKRAAVVGSLAGLVALQAAGLTGVAGAQTTGGGKIGPNQIFAALVNGENGYSSPVVIRMVCKGPIGTNSTGHPKPGQTVAVSEAQVIARPDGNTGAHGHEIGVFFNAPPPSAGPASGALIFYRYGTKRLPTAETLPCSGSGNVFFVPLPMSPGTQMDDVVPVRYVS